MFRIFEESMIIPLLGQGRGCYCLIVIGCDAYLSADSTAWLSSPSLAVIFSVRSPEATACSGSHSSRGAAKSSYVSHDGV